MYMDVDGEEGGGGGGGGGGREGERERNIKKEREIALTSMILKNSAEFSRVSSDPSPSMCDSTVSGKKYLMEIEGKVF